MVSMCCVPPAFLDLSSMMSVKKNGKRILTTQCYIDGHRMNARDGIYSRTGTEAQKKSLLVEFEPIKDSKVGELAANFNIVIGKTPEG